MVWSGGDYDELQPILLTAGIEPPKSREALVLIDGANTSLKEVETVERVSVVFESRDEEVVRIARTLWKMLNEKGIPAGLLERRGQAGGQRKRRLELQFCPKV